MNLWRFTPFSAAAVLSIALLAAVDVHAGTSPAAVILQYSAVEGCPDVDTFKGIVVDRLGADAFAEDAPTRVIVLITSHGQAFEGNMEWLDAKGNWAGDRTYPAHSSDCHDLARAIAFALALHLQLVGVARTSKSASVQSSSSEVKICSHNACLCEPAV